MLEIISYGVALQVLVQMVLGENNIMISVLKVHDSHQFELYDKEREFVQTVNGQSITISGWYNSSKEPEYLFNGKPVKKSKNTKIEFIGNNKLLTIFKLEDTHTGSYEFFHPSLNTVGRLYLYVKSNNFFVPNESYEILCVDTVCIVPCRLTNIADETHVRLYLNGMEHQMSYDSRIGFKINRSQLRTDQKIINATCQLRYQKSHYNIEIQEKFPIDWKLQLTTTNPWPSINETVFFKSTVSCNMNCRLDSFKGMEILLRYEGKEKCGIKSFRGEQITTNGNSITMEKEFIIQNYTPTCSGKFISEIRNISTKKIFHPQSLAYLDQLELVSLTDPNVEIMVGQEYRIAAKFRAPKQERQQRLDISSSLFSEELLCQESSCIVYNETKLLGVSTTNNKTINISRTVAADKPGWYRYSVKIYKSGCSYSIQKLHWNIHVQAPIQLLSNCSSRLLQPTLCEFTCISTVPDDLNMYISRVKNIEDNPLKDLHLSSKRVRYLLTDVTNTTVPTTRTISTQFHYLKTFVASITRTTSIGCHSLSEMPKFINIDCVEFAYSVGSSFDNVNSQDIYQGDNVTLKGGIAESNESFRILHSSDAWLASIITRKYTTLVLRNYTSISREKLYLLNSTGYVLATINLPASKKIISPFNSDILTVYYNKNTTHTICPILGSPIIYNWTKNGTHLTGEHGKHLVLNSSDPLGNYVCCGMNRAGSECAIINVLPENSTSAWRNGLTIVNILIFIVVICFVGNRLFNNFTAEPTACSSNWMTEDAEYNSLNNTKEEHANDIVVALPANDLEAAGHLKQQRKSNTDKYPYKPWLSDTFSDKDYQLLKSIINTIEQLKKRNRYIDARQAHIEKLAKDIKAMSGSSLRATKAAEHFVAQKTVTMNQLAVQKAEINAELKIMKLNFAEFTAFLQRKLMMNYVDGEFVKDFITDEMAVKLLESDESCNENYKSLEDIQALKASLRKLKDYCGELAEL